MIRILFILLLLLHGLIHMMGFAKSFRLAEIPELKMSIPKPYGILWGITAFDFIAASVLLIFNNPDWWQIGISALVMSQFLILLYWKDAKFGSLANALVALGILITLQPV